MPGLKKVESLKDFERVMGHLDHILMEAEGQLIGLYRQLGRRIAKVPAREYAKVTIDEVIKESESILKKTMGAWRRCRKATEEFRKKTRKKQVRFMGEHVHTILHDVFGLHTGISALAEAWAEEVEDLDMIQRIQERREAEEHLDEDEYQRYIR